MLPHEPTIRLGVFLGVLLVLLAFERLVTWGHARPLGLRRWPGNLGLALAGAVLVRAAVPAAAVGAAAWAEGRGLGLVPALGLPGWAAIPPSVVLLRPLIYLQPPVAPSGAPPWR